MNVEKNLGVVTAYGSAIQGGYNGTAEEFYEELANLPQYASRAETAAETSEEDVQTVLDAKDAAETAAQNASDSASTASTAAQNASAAQQAAEDAQAAAEDAAASITTDDTLSITGKAADAKKTGDEIAELKNDLSSIGSSALPSKSASGSVVTIADGADGAALKSLVLNLEPTQSGSGDPSPSNIRPITGYDSVSVVRAGKNLLPSRTNTTVKNDITLTVNQDGSLTANGTASADVTFGLPTDATTVYLPDTTKKYVVTGCPDGGSSTTYRLVLYLYLDGVYTNVMKSEYGSGITLDPTDGSFNQYRINVQVKSRQTVNNLTFKPMIRPASITDDTYEPYKCETIPISLSSAGTVYGGSLDVMTGVLTVDKGYTTVGDITWSYESNYTRFYGLIPDIITGIATSRTPFICSAYQTIDDGRTLSSVPDGSIYGAGSTANVYIKDTRYTDSATFKSEMGDVQIVYPLMTPSAYHLTPTEVTTLLGDNTIWMDAEGTIDATYRVDTQMYVDNRIKSTQGIIAPVEDSYTATANYAIGDYLIVEDTLYKVTAAIASGGTITPDTNVTATTVMAQIKALA